MTEPVFHLFIASCLLQGPPGSKGEKGERVSGSTPGEMIQTSYSPI